jgi:hypothetical protein
MAPPRRYKSSFTVGLEHVLNTPSASFINSAKVFNEIHEKTGMTTTQMLKHIGRRKRHNTPKEPTDDERSKERLAKLQAASEAK